MKKMEKNHYKIHRDLLDIVRGYSELVFAEEVFYFKHFSVEQSLEHEALVEVDIEKSKKSGIKTKEEILELSKATGAWSDASEEELKSKKWILNKSLTALSKIQDDNQRKIFNKQIENQRIIMNGETTDLYTRPEQPKKAETDAAETDGVEERVK